MGPKETRWRCVGEDCRKERDDEDAERGEKGERGSRMTLVEWKDVSKVSNIVCHSCMSRHTERSSSLKRSKGF